MPKVLETKAWNCWILLGLPVVYSISDNMAAFAFWRATFDNLDFRIRFAKKLSTGGHLKRMLHLLTSQVSFRHTSWDQFNDNEQKLNAADLKENNFKLNHENSEWIKFSNLTYRCTETSEEADKPLLSNILLSLKHPSKNTLSALVFHEDNEGNWHCTWMDSLVPRPSDWPKPKLTPLPRNQSEGLGTRLLHEGKTVTRG